MPSHCPHNQQASCSDCNLSTLCLPLSLELNDLDRVDNVIRRGLPLQKGEQLFRSGDRFTSIYAVRSGCFKCTRTTQEGEEQITGFFLPGEIFGLDGLNSNQYLSTATALETAAICSLLSKNTAEERVAAMLLSLSARYKRQRLSATQFIMPMSRMDVGNYLGLTIETVSRTFSLLKI